MSKIQKALNALKGSKKEHSALAPRNEERGVLNRHVTVADRDYNKEASSGFAPGKVALKSRDENYEPTPKHSVEIRLDSLEKAGIYPSSDDLEIISQQFRRIKRPIIQSAFEVDLPIGQNANVIMMASALPGAGKSFCACNLAQSVALEREIGSVLVDADVLKPGISNSFGLQDHVGLIDYLVDSSIDLEDILVQTNLDGIVVIPAGRKHPEATELLASRRMKGLVSLLSERYKNRIVVFDMPPLLLTSEAQALAAQAGQIVMVIEARVSSRDSAVRALGMLDRQKPINAILNKSRSAAGSGYQHDDYGYYPYPSGGDANDNI